MADTVAELMVKIGGDASGLESALQGAKGSVDGLASGMKSIGIGLTAAVTVPLVALGAAAMKASSDVNGAYRQIQRETGATGTELATLKQSFKDVFTTVPASADEVATALSRLTQTLDTTAQTTEELAVQFLNLSRMTGTDLTSNINAVTDSFNGWGVESKDMETNLDALYVISQQTGQAVSDIAQTTATAAGPAKELGMSYQETAIIIAQLGQAGVPTKQVLSSMTAIVKDSITNNTDAATTWQNLVDKFKDPAYKATADDMAIIGTNTIKFANAAKQGDLDYAPLLAKIKESPDAINAMAENTGTLSESLTVLKNRLTVALEPLGTAIFGVTKDIVKDMTPAMTIVENLGKAFDKLPEPVKKATVVLGAVAASMGPVLTVAPGIVSALAQIAPGFISVTTSAAPLLIPLAAIGVALGVLAIGLGIAYTASATFRGVLGTLTTAFTTFGGSVMTAITQLTSGDFSGALDTIRTALNKLVVDLSTINWSSVGDKIKTEIANAFSDKSSTLNLIADQLTKMIQGVPWNQLGALLGQGLGEMISIGLGALTGTGDTGGVSPIESALIGTTGGKNGISSGGMSGLKEAGKSAVGQFIAGFQEGLEEGMRDINWGAVIAALWDGLAAVGPEIFGKDKNILDYMSAGGAGDNTDAMREWILKQLPSAGDIQDAIGKWWDGIVWPDPAAAIGKWWDTQVMPALGNLGKGAEAYTLNLVFNLPFFGPAIQLIWDFLKFIFAHFSTYTATLIFQVFADDVKAIFNMLKEWVGKQLTIIVNFVKGLGQELWNIFSGAASTAGKALNVIVNFIKGVGQELWNILSGAATAAGKAVNIIVNFLKGVGGDLFNLLTGGASKAISIIVALANNVRTLITNAIGGAFNFVVQLASNVRGIITSAIGGAYNFLLNLASDARSMVTASIGGAFTFLLTLISDARSMITASIGGAFDIMIGIATDIRGAIQAKIGGAFDATVNVLAHLLGAGGITEWVDSKLGGWGLGLGAKPVAPPTPVSTSGTAASTSITATGSSPSIAPIGAGASDSAPEPSSYPTSSGCGPGYYFVQCSTCPPGVGSCQPAGAEGFQSGKPRLAVYGEAGPEARVPKAMWGMPWDYVLSHVPIANRATLAVPGAGGPEAFIPKAMWGKPWGTVLGSLPKLQGGAVSGGSGDSSWDKALKQTADYAVNLKPIHDATTRALNYAIVTTQNTAAVNQNTGVANQHLNNITAVGQATTAACNTTADACAATTAACSDNCTTATDGNTAAIAGSCASMANSCAATASSCAATAGSCGATAGSCGSTASSCGAIATNTAGYAPSAATIAAQVASAQITNTPYTDTPWEKPGEGWWWSTGTGSWQPPSYASGGYISHDQLAYVHKGEYVMPASEFGGGGGTQYGGDRDNRWRDDDRRWKDDDRKWKHDHEKHHRHGNNYIHVEGVKAEEIAAEIARQQRIRDIMML